MFEPFYRIETSRSRETGGTGLGLTIALNITRQHNGDLVLRNHPDGGLEFAKPADQILDRHRIKVLMDQLPR